MLNRTFFHKAMKTLMKNIKEPVIFLQLEKEGHSILNYGNYRVELCCPPSLRDVNWLKYGKLTQLRQLSGRKKDITLGGNKDGKYEVSITIILC